MPSTTTGPSTSQSPYLTPTDPHVRFVSLISAGDAVDGAKWADGSPWHFGGIADGIGAYANGDGTMTVLVNHEYPADVGTVRDTGAPGGAYVDRLTINLKTLQVVKAEELGQRLFVYDPKTGTYQEQPDILSRLCSADLPNESAFYDAASGLGTKTHIFLNGEESGAEGRAFAWIADGKSAGDVYELPWLGNLSFENVLASPHSGEKTVVIGNDDTTGGQLYMYVGEKRESGSEIERAGLTDGVLYGIKADFATESSAGQSLSGSFSLAPFGDASGLTGAELQTQSEKEGVTAWLRPEDGAWDTINPNRYYFVTTNAFDAPSRLWALDFRDAKHPELGGTYRALLDGTEGQKMLDNITVSRDGKVVMQEDVGNNPRSGKVWSYDPKTDKLTQLAEHDIDRFGNETTPAGPPFTQDEESSGVVDVTHLFPHANGKQMFLLDTQAHYDYGADGSADRQEIVEGGQLQLMVIEDGDRRPGHWKHDDSHARIDHDGIDLHHRPHFMGWHDAGHGMHGFPTLTGEPPLVVGHRGASGLRPEHTLESYKLAIAQGADFIEPDVVPTKDGYLIARHEPELGGTTDVADHPEFADRQTTKFIDGTKVTGWFAEDFTLAEIKTLYARERIPEIRPDNTAYDGQFRIPTLDEIIDLVKQTEAETGRKIGIIPETKHPTYFKYEGKYLDGSPIHQDTSQMLVDRLVANHFTDFDRVVIQSFELANLIDLQTRIMPEACIDVQLVQLLNEGGYDIAFNFDPSKADQGADSSIYDKLDFKLSADSLTNGDLYKPEFLKAIHKLYAELIGSYKDDILPVTTLDKPVDGNGDGKAEITRQLTGEETSLVHDAHAAGLKVVPYTIRIEEPFLTLSADGAAPDATTEFRNLIAAGVDGFFTDFPGLGREVVDEIAKQDGGFGKDDWHGVPRHPYDIGGSWSE
ncbi:MAG: glycerophosphodiester phosphodiesterase family protein [Acetobacteraceae bacterium]